MVAFWIWFCALLNCVGWILSACHALNRTGYVVAFAVATGGALIWRARGDKQRLFRIDWRKLYRRFRKPFPLAFLLLAGLALLGGALHLPSNYDALAYRIPRVLHWLAEERWHWIHTDFPRLNSRACGIEWVSAPLIAFTQSDRLLFLINAASFLLLPGLFFSLLTRLGVGARVAWRWMWLLPTGYCYLLQAGSIGNDLFAAVFALAAVDFALRARVTRSPRDFWLAVLAAALLTGGKTSNLPLLLPCVIALLPAWRLALQRPLATTAVCALALMASFVPVGVINWKHCGDWTGLKLEGLQLTKGEPVIRVANNTVLLTIQNLRPPVFPWANAWNHTAEQIRPRGFAQKVESDFEPGGARWMLGEMEMEESAGLGGGLTLLLAASVIAAWRRRQTDSIPSRTFVGTISRNFILGGAGLALLVFMLKSNLTSAARLATPYYGLLVPGLLLASGHAWVIRRRWWHWSAAAVFLVAGLLLALSPARPLWPAQTVLASLVAGPSANPLWMRAYTVYSVYGSRADSFRPVLDRLPVEAQPLGLVATDTVETALWRPFGRRRILHVSPSETAADLQRRGIIYVLVSAETWTRLGRQSFDSWATANGAVRLEEFHLKLRASEAPSVWLLVKLPGPVSKNSSAPAAAH